MFAFLNDSHESGGISVYTAAQEADRARLLQTIADLEADLKSSTPDRRERLVAWEESVAGDQPESTVVRDLALDDNSAGGQKFLPQGDGSWLAQSYAPTKSDTHFEAVFVLKEPATLPGDGTLHFHLSQKHGGWNWHTGNALGNLAVVEFLSEAYEGAASLFDESIAILEHSPRAEPFILQTLLRSKALNALHTEGPDSASAREAARRAVAVYRQNLARVLSFTTEQERLDWRSRESPLALIASLGMAEETAGLLLSSKGIVLDSIAEDRRAASRSGENWPQLQRLRGQVRAARLPPEHGAPEIAALEEECQRLERAIARETGSFGETRRSLGFSPAHIAEALPATSAYIDFFRYAHAIGDETPEEKYAAIVISAGTPLGRHRTSGRPRLPSASRYRARRHGPGLRP